MNEADHLIRKYLDAELTPDERRRLSALVVEDPQVREQLRHSAEAHGLLLVLADARTARSTAGIENIPLPALVPEKETAGWAQRRRWFAQIALPLAACLTLILSLRWYWSDTRPAAAVARLTTENLLDWSDGDRPDRNGWMGRGTYKLRAGMARLQTEAGAIISIAAPAEFQLVAADEMHLQTGKLLARMLGSKSRLRVIANGLNVNDLGTAFGINTSPAGPSLLSVLDGKVELQNTLPNTPNEVITAGNSLVVANNETGQSTVHVAFDRNTFEDLWPLTLGVDAVSSLVTFLPPGPYDNPMHEFKSDTRLFIMPERQGVELTEPLTIEAKHSGREGLKETYAPSTLVGRRVDSYLLFFNPASATINRPITLSGSITFNRPILGLIFRDNAMLYKSDQQVGIPGLNYRARGRRGLELFPEGKPAQDVVEVSADGRQLFFNFHVSFERDQLRVILASESSNNH